MFHRIFIIVSVTGSVFSFADDKEISLAHPIGKDNALIDKNNVQPWLSPHFAFILSYGQGNYYKHSCYIQWRIPGTVAGGIRNAAYWLRVEAVGRCATHFEALLTAGIADIRDAVLYRSPFQLGEHDKIFSFARPIGVDVMRRPVNQRGRSGNKMDRFSGVW